MSAGSRFGRLFGFLPVRPLSAEALDELLRRIERSEGSDNPFIPAGYTYLGQFIDHDLTFDPTSQLEKVNDPHALVNFRTPRLDLDSLYGAGPSDQPFLYEWTTEADRGVKLLVGGTADCADLPRNHQARALLGDARNDENLITAQLHLLFIRFHNSVVEHVRETQHISGAELLREAQRIVRWHYQWIVAHDFLRRVVGATTLDSVLPPDVTAAGVRRRFYDPFPEPFIPVEFSAAAYRFGHSMVRDGYRLRHADTVESPVFRAPGDPDLPGDLRGFRPLRREREIQWDLFFELSDASPQLSRRIDTNIALALRFLPKQVNDESVLARLNLRRARALELPAGPDVARAMGETPLTERQLLLHVVADEGLRKELMRTVPLWYYILREAKALHGGDHLGPVGGRIVAEVLLGLLEADPSSYLRQWPAWRPELPPHNGDFTMADLVRFTQSAVAAPRSP
jgi:hypothetical protein